MIKSKDTIRKRTQVIKKASFVGIISNFFLFMIKLVIGLLSGSFSIIVDAINNLSDFSSSLVILVGSYFINKTPDEEHPFGYGRYEYISALIVAMFIVIVGFNFLIDGIKKLNSPSDLNHQWYFIVILLLTVLTKLLMGIYYKKKSKEINSLALKASSTDSFLDVFVTLTTILVLFLYSVFDINLDGIFGVIIAIFVIYGGISLIRETISPLIGEPVSLEILRGVKKTVLDEEGVLGIHDLVFHTYGEEVIVVTLHCEIAEDLTLNESHKIIDTLEKKIMALYKMTAVIHIDPIHVNDSEIMNIRNKVLCHCKSRDEKISIHDIRIEQLDFRRKVTFEVVVPFYFNQVLQKGLNKDLCSLLEEVNKEYLPEITIEYPYVFDGE